MSKTPFAPEILKHKNTRFFTLSSQLFRPPTKIVTVTFFSAGMRPTPRFKIWTFIYKKTDITTLGDLKQYQHIINNSVFGHFSFYRHVYRQVKNITMEKEQLYRCDKCDYTTSRKFNYLKHIETEKHKSPLHVMSKKMSIFENLYQTPQQIGYRCPNCDRKYMAQRSLWRHSKQCSSDNNIDKSVYNLFSSKIADLCQSNAELSKTNQIQQSQMIQLCTAVLTTIGQNLVVAQSVNNSSNHANTTTSATPLAVCPSEPARSHVSNIHNTMTMNNNLTVNGNMTNNSNNKTFNINMFLNEECKDAMNMTDFVKTIELDTNDMEDVGKRGFVKGISKIFIDNLEKTDVTKRPIHCSDSKREVLYIKDDNKWEREGIHSKKLLDAIHTVEHKNVIMVNEWAKTHPQCENSETQANQIYMTLAKHATDGDEENVAKVAKQIAKSVIIDKNDF